MRDVLVRSILVLAAGACLAGCSSSPERTAERDSERCAARGLEPNSEAFKTCLVQMESGRQFRTDARHRDMLERSSNPFPR